ncbi:Ig-like domain-containing protein, partial [Desulfosporosinus shakirovi]|uniref:Ig-like domain-containing protein n=1 Tax=Desulfosporosinus shakirovi TaxID=2885154 RepID=UPI001E5D2224
NNGSTTSAAISWDGGTPAYDGNTSGTYKFTGTLILPNGVYNPNSYNATVNVIVGTPLLTVTSVNSLNNIEVSMGTSLSQVGLLDTVIISLNNGSTTSAAISWDGGTPAYDGNTSGTYKFTGMLTLPSGVSNPDNYTATVNVIVSTTNITEGDIFDYVITGTHLTIPTRTVTISYNPDDVQLIDLFGLTTALDTMTSGPIPGTNITINQNTAGTIKFTVNLPISSETSWSGVLNSIKFKAKVSHPSISYTVQ